MPSHDDRHGPHPFLDLPEVILEIVVERLDFCELVHLGRCCVYLKLLCLDNDLWFYNLVKRRWNVATIRNKAIDCDGGSPQSRVYTQIYANWHQRNRMPTSPFSGQRFFAFACSSIHKRPRSYVQQWCTLKSSADCRLWRQRLVLRLIVQNSTTKAVWLQVPCTRLTLKNHTCLTPTAHKVAFVHNVVTPGAAVEGGSRAPEAPEVALRHPYAFAVLELTFQFPRGLPEQELVFEPEALEQCQCLTLHCTAAPARRGATGSSVESESGRDQELPLAEDLVPSCVFGSAGKVCDCFERLPGNAFIFNQENGRQSKSL